MLRLPKLLATCIHLRPLWYQLKTHLAFKFSFFERILTIAGFWLSLPLFWHLEPFFFCFILQNIKKRMNYLKLLNRKIFALLYFAVFFSFSFIFICLREKCNVAYFKLLRTFIWQSWFTNLCKLLIFTLSVRHIFKFSFSF